jgi:protein arginine kinase activator
MKCERCNKPATVHLTEIHSGKQIVKHLCEQCAAQNDGLVAKAHAPINELLTNFVLAHSGLQKEGAIACDRCGLTWSEFRQGGMLGCEHDYIAFDKELTPLLQKAHDNATHHIGKVPHRHGGAAPGALGAAGDGGLAERAGALVKRQVDLVRLRKELARAVETEDYERAAKLRDQIKDAEEA